MKCVGGYLLLVGVCLGALMGVLGDENSEQDCECVVYYLCSVEATNTNGTQNVPCEHYLHTCCKKSNIIREPIPPIVNHTVTGCGQSNPEGIGFRIVETADGQAQFGEFPWMVALRQEAANGTDQSLNASFCGGALIHPKVVLTAAHCVHLKPKQELIIRAGEWDTQTTDELFPHQDRTVSLVIVHKDYYAGPLFNDIALLILHDPVTEAENVGVVCLPNQEEVFDHTRCLASGWGTDVFGKEGRYQKILKKKELPIVSRPACLNSLRQSRLGRHFELHESFICAGGEHNRTMCKGDGGSPLVCPLKDDPLHYQQVGIMAWSIGCGEERTPAVYVNIAKFRNWIDQQMAAANLDSSSYTH